MQKYIPYLFTGEGTYFLPHITVILLGNDIVFQASLIEVQKPHLSGPAFRL